MVTLTIQGWPGCYLVGSVFIAFGMIGFALIEDWKMDKRKGNHREN